MLTFVPQLLLEQPVRAISEQYAKQRNFLGRLPLRAKRQHALVMEDNALELYPIREQLHDFIATPKKRQVMLWFGDRDIGLDLSFERISFDELTSLLSEDFERSKKEGARLQQKPQEGVDQKQQEQMREFTFWKHVFPTWIENVPEDLREMVREQFMTGDHTGPGVKKWVRVNCMQSDGKIPFLNFTNLSFFFSGKRIRIRNGINAGCLLFHYCGFISDAVSTLNLPCPG